MKIKHFSLFLIFLIRYVSSQDVRLVGGATPNEGRVEVFYNGEWGTVCDNGWDFIDAAVVCRQLGLGPYVEAVLYGQYGQGNGTIWLEEVACNISANSIQMCGNNGWGNHDRCRHYQDAGVRCSQLDVRLGQRAAPNEGRVEVFYNDEWGTVCNNGWDVIDATVVCRQLGLGLFGVPVLHARYRQRNSIIWLDQVACNISMNSIKMCGNNGWGNHDGCRHYEDAGVKCFPEFNLGSLPYQIQLNKDDDVSNVHEGPVYMVFNLPNYRPSYYYYYYYNYDIDNIVTGSISSVNWNVDDANVVCRQLGFRGGTNTSYSYDNEILLLNNVTCNGNEEFLHLCGYSLLPVNDLESSVAGVICDVEHACLSNPCLFGGVCTDLIDGYSCNCLPGVSGKRCETEITSCNSNPCLNGGHCINHNTDYICICSSKYSGPRCEDVEEVETSDIPVLFIVIGISGWLFILVLLILAVIFGVIQCRKRMRKPTLPTNLPMSPSSITNHEYTSRLNNNKVISDETYLEVN